MTKQSNYRFSNPAIQQTGYMAKKHLINKWKEHYDFLKQADATANDQKAKEIERLCGWSQRTFYRKMETPDKLSISEKLTIAKVYQMLPHFLFPEMETETV